MNNYEEKQARKADYYRQKAGQANQASNSAYEASGKLSDSIPFGQPILIGHHSEGRHRRDLNRIHNLMDKSIDEKNKSEYYEAKAENAENPAFISSDDPEAITKLKTKLEALEAKHAKLKATPKEKRAWYVLPYSKAEIKRIKDRIAGLEEKAKMPDVDEEIKGVKIQTDKPENRLRLYFPSIPSEEMRAKLKQNGFRWSPFNQAWQRQISAYAIVSAREIIKKVQI